MKRYWITGLLALNLLMPCLLTGCGQPGPLYLPEKKAHDA